MVEILTAFEQFEILKMRNTMKTILLFRQLTLEGIYNRLASFMAF